MMSFGNVNSCGINERTSGKAYISSIEYLIVNILMTKL